MSSTFLEFSSVTGFAFTILLAFFPYKITYCFSCLMDYFLELIFKVPSLVFVVVSNNCFPYLLDRFYANDKKPYPLTFFSALSSIEYHLVFIY